MPRGLVRFLAALWLLMVIATPRAGRAQSLLQRNEARKLGGEALDLFKAADFKAALAKFEQADKLVPAPTLKVRIARCLDRLDRLREAADKYREVIAIELKFWSPKVHAEARAEAVDELAKLISQVPKLTVLVVGPGSQEASVTLDGKPVPPSALGEAQPMDPGAYQLEARARGRVVSKSVKLVRGKAERLELRLASDTADEPALAAKARDPSSSRIAGWTMLGVSGAGLVVGTVAAALVFKDRSALASQCNPDGICPASAAAEVDKFNRERIVSTSGFVAGGVAGAIGASLLVYAATLGRPATQAKEPEIGARRPAFTIVPHVDVNGAGFCGTF